MGKKLYEYSLEDVLWDMYSTKDFDKIKKCTRPLEWHRFGHCDVCGSKAFRFTYSLYDRLYVLEDSEIIHAAVRYLLNEYRTDFFTRREKSLPIVSTAPVGTNGFVFKAEFYMSKTNTLIFVLPNDSSKIASFGRVVEHFKNTFKCLLLLFDRNTKDIEIQKKKKQIQTRPKMSARRRISGVRTRFRLKRLVNPANPSDVYYVPWNELKPLVEMYDGDRNRAERRWWRRKIKQRNKQYRKP